MHHYKFYGFFIGALVMILISCDALAFKTIHFFGYEFAASGIIFVFSFPLASIATEVYGYQLAGRIIWIQLMCQLIFILLISFIVRLNVQENDTMALLYFSLYKNLWRVLLAGSLAVPTAYFINDMVLSLMKKYYGGFLFSRMFFSNLLGQFLLVFISYPINFYHIYSLSHIIHIAVNTWVYKAIMAIALLPITGYLAKKIKRIEHLDFYDYGISYNPIKVFNANNPGENHYEKF